MHCYVRAENKQPFLFCFFEQILYRITKRSMLLPARAIDRLISVNLAEIGERLGES